MSVFIVVLIVWTLVAVVALALARTLCAVAARADAEHAEHTARCPVEVPRHGPASTLPDSRRAGEGRIAARSLAHR